MSLYGHHLTREGADNCPNCAKKKAKDPVKKALTKKAKPDPLADLAHAAARYVAAQPVERGSAAALAGTWLAGAMTVHSDPSTWAMLALPVGGIAWTVTRKHGDKQWRTAVTGIATALPAWCAVTATTHSAGGRVGLAYVCTAAAGWIALVSSDVAGKRRRWVLNQQTWSKEAAKIGLEGSRLVKRTEHRLGHLLRIDTRGTGRRVSEILKGTALREDVAARYGLPLSRVLAEPDRTAGFVLVNIRVTDPWATEVPWRRDLPARGRSVMGPIPIGEDPETGEPLTLTLMDKDGGTHVLIISGSGGGKTTLINNVLEHLTACEDAEVVAIDVTKGKDIRNWAPALSATATGPDEFDEALAILRGAKRLVEERAARIGADSVHKPTPSEPALVVIIDEASALLTEATPRGKEARDLVSWLNSKGRSEAVVTMTAAQRGVLSHLGTGDIKANVFTRVLLGVSSKAEQSFVLGHDWEALGIPDMSKYGEGSKGCALVVEQAGGYRTGRVANFSDLAEVAALAAERARPDVAPVVAEAAWDDVAPGGPSVAPVVAEVASGGPDLAFEVPALPVPANVWAAVKYVLSDQLSAGRAELANAMRLGPSQAAAHLAALVQADLLIPEGNGPARVYRLNEHAE